MKSGDILNNKYEIISRLSVKGYRQKWLATDTDNYQKVTIETLHDDLINDKTAIENIRYELQVSQTLSHPLFPKCIDTFLHNERL